MSTTVTRYAVINQEKPFSKTGTEKQRIQRYLLECWFPASPQALKDIKANLRDGLYPNSAVLVDHLRNDFALYTHCLRQIALYLKNNPKPELEGKNLVSGLADLPLSLFDEMLPISPAKISSHNLKSIPEPQVLRLQHVVISTTAAMMLANKLKVDAQTAYTAALMRQLPTTLIAFNYPRVFEKLAGANPVLGPEFDARIENLLGCSPTQLTMELTNSWPLTDEIRALMQALKESPAGQNGSTPGGKDVSTLSTICGISEALTTYSQAESNPEQKKRWLWASSEVNGILGSGGMSELAEAIQDRWEDYSAALPVLYARAFSTNSAAHEKVEEHVKKRYVENGYIAKCDRLTQEAFLRVYKQMAQSKPSQLALKLLISELIPSTGFERGCIFLSEESQVHFVPVPTVMIGDVSKEDFKPVFMSAVGLVTDPLSKAVVNGMCIKGSTYRHTQQVLYIVGPLGCTAKRGVLYLESTHEDYLEGREDVLSYFKAIHRCLADALNIQIPPEAISQKSVTRD